MQRLTTTIDDDLIAEVDEFIGEHGYANRSEAIRDLLRSGLQALSTKTPRQPQLHRDLELCLRPCGARAAEAADQGFSRRTTASRRQHFMCISITIAVWK